MNRGTDAGFFGLRFYRKAVSWITVFVILFSLVNPQMTPLQEEAAKKLKLDENPKWG
jgi:hypothetical protein